MHEGGRGREGDAVAFWHAANLNPQGRVRFSGSGWPEGKAVLVDIGPRTRVVILKHLTNTMV
jgi:hypothetical protein